MSVISKVVHSKPVQVLGLAVIAGTGLSACGDPPAPPPDPACTSEALKGTHEADQARARAFSSAPTQPGLLGFQQQLQRGIGQAELLGNAIPHLVETYKGLSAPEQKGALETALASQTNDWHALVNEMLKVPTQEPVTLSFGAWEAARQNVMECHQEYKSHERDYASPERDALRGTFRLLSASDQTRAMENVLAGGNDHALHLFQALANSASAQVTISGDSWANAVLNDPRLKRESPADEDWVRSMANAYALAFDKVRAPDREAAFQKLDAVKDDPYVQALRSTLQNKVSGVSVFEEANRTAQAARVTYSYVPSTSNSPAAAVLPSMDLSNV